MHPFASAPQAALSGDHSTLPDISGLSLAEAPVSRKARIQDVDGMSNLINEFASARIMLARGPLYLYQNIQDYRVITAMAGDREVVLACGGMGYPALGGRGSGYELARQAGHTITPPVPALVGLKSAEAWAAELPGVLLPDATTRFGRKLKSRGELIFTHTGVSGPAVLDLSGSVAQELADRGRAVLECSWESREAEEYRERIASWQRNSGTRSLKGLLGTTLPAAFVRALLDAAGIPVERCAAQLRAEERERLVAALSGYPLKICGTDGWNKAMATAGGIPIAEIHAGTLASRIAAGLYFAGEMIDVGAPCGGYNIQWAVSSGRLAGLSAARR